MRIRNKKVRRLGVFTNYRFTKHLNKSRIFLTFTIRDYFPFLQKYTEQCKFLTNKHKTYLKWKRVQRNNLIISKPVKCKTIVNCSKISISDIDKMCCTPKRYWSLQFGKE